MYHQFMELAGVDITREAMEIGPTCHYIMGGVQVDADTEETAAPGLFAAGEVAAACTVRTGSAATRSATSSSLASAPGAGRRTTSQPGRRRRSYVQAEVDAAVADALAPLDREGGENPYDIQRDLQETMQSLVGIIRSAGELEAAAVELDKLTERVKNVSVKGPRAYNPGWNLATDLPSMITVSKCVTLGATLRTESRGGHTREDFPAPDPELGKVNFAQTSDGGNWDSPVTIVRSPILVMPDELKALLEEAK